MIKFGILYYISFISIFFPMMILYIIPGTNAYFQASMILTIFTYFLLIFNKKAQFILFLKTLLKFRIFQIYCIFAFFCIMNALGHFLLGYYSAPFYYYFWRTKELFFSSILIYMLPIIGIYQNIRIKSIIKLLYKMISIITIIGIVQYLFFVTDNDFLIKIIDLLSPGRSYREDVMDCRIAMRVYSVFDEPAMFARFIFITLPLMFNLSLSKFKMYTNKWLNKIIKKSIIPLMFFALIFTKSPIFLVACTIEISLLLIIRNFKYIKKYFISILIGSIIIVCVLAFLFLSFKNQLQTTYMGRIMKFVENIENINKFILIEQSLGTRILSYITNITTFTQNFFFGVGMINSEIYAQNILLKLDYPLTGELIEKYFHNSYAVSLNASVIYTTLAENGLVGLTILAIFLYKNIKTLFVFSKYTMGMEQTFCVGLVQSLIALCVNSFYNLNFTDTTFWLLLGITFSYLYYKKMERSNR